MAPDAIAEFTIRRRTVGCGKRSRYVSGIRIRWLVSRLAAKATFVGSGATSRKPTNQSGTIYTRGRTVGFTRGTTFQVMSGSNTAKHFPARLLLMCKIARPNKSSG